MAGARAPIFLQAQSRTSAPLAAGTVSRIAFRAIRAAQLDAPHQGAIRALLRGMEPAAVAHMFSLSPARVAGWQREIQAGARG